MDLNISCQFPQDTPLMSGGPTRKDLATLREALKVEASPTERRPR